MKKTLIVASFAVSSLGALEFGQMGNLAASMGGAGVAIDKSAWGLYYNPALLGTSKVAHFSYSFGANYKQQNLTKLLNIDPKSLNNFSTNFKNIFGSAQAATAATGAQAVALVPSGFMLSATTAAAGANGGSQNTIINGLFGEVIKELLKGSGQSTNGEISEQNVKQLAESILKEVGENGGNVTLENFKEKITSADKGGKVFDKFKEHLNKANKATGNNPFITLLANNLTPQNVGDLVTLIGKGNNNQNLDFKSILQGIGGLKISANNVDGGLKDVVKSLNTVVQSLKKNDISITSQNGIIIQMPTKKGSLGNGGFAMGVLASVFSSASAQFDPTHQKIIIGGNNTGGSAGGSGSYLQIQASGDDILLTPVDSNSGSIFDEGAKHRISAAGLGLIEIPFGYGTSFKHNENSIAIGASIKLLHGIGYEINKEGSFSTLRDIKLPKEPVSSDNVGIDLGGLYKMGSWRFGFVTKYINFPSLKISKERRVTLTPQVRAGVAYEAGSITYALDADILANNTMSQSIKKNQMIGAGVMADMRFFSLRGGLMFDVKNLTAPILTTGMNAFSVLDLALQVSTKWEKVRQYYAPNYLGVKVGSSFTF